MWDYMGLIRVYTKRRGAPPEFREPLVMSSERRGVNVEVACENISRGEYRVEPAHTGQDLALPATPPQAVCVETSGSIEMSHALSLADRKSVV